MKEPKIDLSKCKPGQKLMMRNGETANFLGSSHYSRFPYLVCLESGETRTYTAKGTVFTFSGSNYDIIAILPLKRPKPRPIPSPSKAAKASQSALKRDLLAIHREMKAVMGRLEAIINKS